MPSAIEQIVDAYVRLKNRRGLDELMMHRQRLAVDLKSRSGRFDFSLPIGKIDEEIAIIEEGLSRLKDSLRMPAGYVRSDALSRAGRRR